MLLIGVIGIALFNGVDTTGLERLEKALETTALVSALITVVSDAGMEYYYQRYKEFDYPDKYRRYSTILNRIRNVAIVSTVMSATGSLGLKYILNRKRKISILFQHEKGIGFKFVAVFDFM